MSSLPKTFNGEGRPANVYYFRRISIYWVGLAIFVGAFLCSGLGSAPDASQTTVIMAWSAYAMMLAVMLIIDPLAIIGVRRIDESGGNIWLYRPLVGWKSTELILGLDELLSPGYDQDHGVGDERLGDVSIILIWSEQCSSLI